MASDLPSLAVMQQTAVEIGRVRMLHAPGADGIWAPDGRPFGSVARGDGRIALALYRAQGRVVSAPPPSDADHRARTLDEIVSMGRRSAGWSRAFKQLKADGLVEEQTLGQVLARWARPAEPAALTPTGRAGLRGVPSRAPSRTAS